MGIDDWFRSSAWDDEAQLAFRKKLARAGNQQLFYLKTKASAIADEHPFDAIKLFDEYIAADDEHFSGGNYSKSMVYLALGEIEAAIEFLSRAIGESGMDMQAPALLEFAFLVGLHKRSEYYPQVLKSLQSLDELAQKSVGRPFERNFAGRAGSAFILYELGKAEDAKHQAEAALRLALAEKGPIPNYPQLGRVPQLPKEWMDRLIMIANIWDESELSPRPATR